MRREAFDELLLKHPPRWTEITGQVALARDARGQVVPLYQLEQSEGLASLVVAAVNLASDDPFLRDVRARENRPLTGGAIASLSEAWVILGRVLVGLQETIDRPADQPRLFNARTRLVELAAVAWRAAKDLGLENVDSAISQDIPF